MYLYLYTASGPFEVRSEIYMSQTAKQKRARKISPRLFKPSLESFIWYIKWCLDIYISISIYMYVNIYIYI